MATRPIKRRKPIQRRGKPRFKKRRDPKFLSWIRALDCHFYPGACWGRVAPAHIKTRGSGGVDLGNCIPLCTFHHTLQEGRNARFEAEYGIDLKFLATTYADRYLAETEVGTCDVCGSPDCGPGHSLPF